LGKADEPLLTVESGARAAGGHGLFDALLNVILLAALLPLPLLPKLSLSLLDLLAPLLPRQLVLSVNVTLLNGQHEVD